MLEGEPVLVELPEGLHANNDTVCLVPGALNGPEGCFLCRNSHTSSHHGFNSWDLEQRPTPFVNHGHIVIIPMRVDDLVFVASSSQLNDVVSESKQCVILKVSTPFLSSDAWAYLVAKYLRQNAPSGC